MPTPNDASIASALTASRSASRATQELVELQAVIFFRPMTHALARRYDRRGLELDDIKQVADLAVVKALRRFDPAAGHLRGFLTASVLGEIKKHFRDLAWAVRPPRDIQDLQSVVAEAMSAEREPVDGHSRARDVALSLQIDESVVLEVMAARANFRSLSLERSIQDGVLGLEGLIASGRDAYADSDRRSELRSLCAVLSPDDRALLGMRFVDELSQHDIALRTGSTQKRVSRALARILTVLRDAAEHPTAA
jgi:RNA polymerase sigma-B factor